jgi:hypothetical protein
MLFSTIQRPTHQARIIRRHVSSKAPTVKSHRTLPSAKMRALISLYHQSDTFITPENLSQRIDEAFIPSETQTGLGHSFGDGYTDLTNALHNMRQKPKLRVWDRENVVVQMDDLWSSAKGGRESKVIEALYGVDITPSREVLPGLEALEESAASKRHWDSFDNRGVVQREALRGKSQKQ